MTSHALQMLQNKVFGATNFPHPAQGPTATNEVLDAAEAMYAFLTAKDEDVGVEAGRRPN
jgi:hypothetical protein